MEVIKKNLLALIEKFKSLKPRQKLLLLPLALLLGVAILIPKMAFHGKLLPTDPQIFIENLGQVADQEFRYRPAGEMESFYDNARVSKDIFLFSKVIVNLKKSPSSGPNPMGAFEFLVEGASSDVILEVKDREVEIKDHLIGVLADLTFDSLDGSEGKKKLAATVKLSINQLLRTGSVNQVYINNFIIKP